MKQLPNEAQLHSGVIVFYHIRARRERERSSVLSAYAGVR